MHPCLCITLSYTYVQFKNAEGKLSVVTLFRLTSANANKYARHKYAVYVYKRASLPLKGTRNRHAERKISCKFTYTFRGICADNQTVCLISRVRDLPDEHFFT